MGGVGGVSGVGGVGGVGGMGMATVVAASMHRSDTNGSGSGSGGDSVGRQRLRASFHNHLTYHPTLPTQPPPTLQPTHQPTLSDPNPPTPDFHTALALLTHPRRATPTHHEAIRRCLAEQGVVEATALKEVESDVLVKMSRWLYPVGRKLFCKAIGMEVEAEAEAEAEVV